MNFGSLANPVTKPKKKKSQHYFLDVFVFSFSSATEFVRERKLLTNKTYAMPTNFYMYFVAGLIPMLVGFVYYNPNVMGKAWMKANGFAEKDLEGANMPLIFGLSYVFSVLLSFFLTSMVIHQTSVFSMMMPDVLEAGSATQQQFNELMEQYGTKDRTFWHGAIHGLFTAIFFVLPIIAINALFERRGWSYILIHAVYWMICLALIGGLLCATLQYA